MTYSTRDGRRGGDAITVDNSNSRDSSMSTTTTKQYNLCHQQRKAIRYIWQNNKNAIIIATIMIIPSFLCLVFPTLLVAIREQVVTTAFTPTLSSPPPFTTSIKRRTSRDSPPHLQDNFVSPRNHEHCVEGGSGVCAAAKGSLPYFYSDSRTNQQQLIIARRRRPVMAGNWKLQPATLAEATNLLKLLHSNFVNHRSAATTADGDTSTSTTTTVEQPEVIVFPPYPFLQEAIKVLEGSGIKVGAQNVDLESNGAYTGQVAASMISSLGCDYVLLGHSERRTLYDETDEEINQKVKLSLEQPGLGVILCIGETEDEYESELLASVVDVQIKKGLKDVPVEDALERIIIAYEPVWAIGTGKVATPEEAQEAHVAVRQSLAALYGYESAAQIRIQYGGSVKPDNVKSLMSMPDVDGALVGGASLTADSFTRIVDGATATARSSVLQSSLPPRPKEFTARECVPTKNVLGESPVWSARDQALYWIDAPEGEIWTWNMKSPAYRRIVGTTLGCVAIRESKTPGAIVLAGENAFLEMTMSATTSDFATGPKILCERPEQTDITRPNDGRVDRQGRFVFGMYNNYHRSPVGEANVAGIYRLNQRCEVESILDDDLKYRVSNCISFSPEGDTMYFCDTPTRKIYAFDYGDDGLTNRRLIWTMPSNLNGGPDGAQVDEEGFLWAALSGAGRVVRIDPRSGVVDMVVHLPVSSPTSCTFGGEDLSELLITTRAPDGGGIYCLKLPFGIRGLPEPEFKVASSPARKENNE